MATAIGTKTWTEVRVLVNELEYDIRGITDSHPNRLALLGRALADFRAEFREYKEDAVEIVVRSHRHPMSVKCRDANVPRWCDRSDIPIWDNGVRL